MYYKLHKVIFIQSHFECLSFPLKAELLVISIIIKHRNYYFHLSHAKLNKTFGGF
jgi:hypothetical protein